MSPVYPECPRTERIELVHGLRVDDPYRWLEDPLCPAARDWVAAQQALAEVHLNGLPGQSGIRRLLRGLVTGPTASPVKPAGARRFRVGRSSALRRWTLQVADEPDAPWRAVVDTAQLGGDGVTVRRWQPSPAGRYLAVQTTVDGAEDITPLNVVDVAARRVVETSPLTRYSSVCWLADERSYYYARRHLDRPGSGVYLHRVGHPWITDQLVTGDDEPVTRYHLALWHDRWLVVCRRHGTSRDTTLLVADRHADGEVRGLELTGTSVGGVLVDHGGRLFAVTTEGARFGRLVAADPDAGGAWRSWRTVLPEQPPSVLTSVSLAGVEGAERLVASRTLDGYSSLTVHDATDGRLLTDVRLPGPGTVSAVNPTDHPFVLAVSYTDWVTPLSVWRVDVRTGDMTPTEAVTRRDEVEVLRTSYPSDDGTEVPMTILALRQRGGRRPRPTVLTCYGGFGITFRPGFQPDALTWVLAGGVMAIAGVRGGGERGRQWHLDGAGPHKPNAVRDLHAAGDHLVRRRWTRRPQLALLGGSNGGLVVTAATVQRPKAYAAVSSAGAPLDMVRYERWGLGRAWRAEYGDVRDLAALATLLSYSPYHNVRPQRGRLPAMLFTTGENDTRVDPAHSRKMVAALQHRTSGGPVLLRVTPGTGHVGGGRESEALATAMLAFLAWHTGLRFDDDG
ncbi:prolyl oligopeptidase family serine peptidase [Actinoalloteichus caeruleus]|uniref:prolyl oligopeptidase family serine peptidase n=2 Tax=Actinoalloteichus cyanogriseus TaxID=2893586 RepID=UPI0005B8504D|nr:prolyl oligopeptidase family serine peptidase [Actinoalloteichus caeruleus]